MSEIKSYLKSRIFWKNILYALGGFVFLLIFTSTCSRIYTHHNRSYAVPDFKDMPLSDAVKLIEKKKLRYEIFDSIYVNGKEAGAIIDQHPKPGFLVKKKRTVFFTINASSPEKIAMPNLVGITLREGKARLESFGLILGNLSYRYDISKSVILEQRASGRVILPGDSVLKGSFIDLVLSKGLGNEMAIVPDLTGLSAQQAKIWLADAMFSLGATVPDESYDVNDPLAAPFIYKQKPVSGASIKVPLGTTVTVWLTVDSLKLPGAVDAEGQYIMDELNYDNESDNNIFDNTDSD
ncbi:MAG: PASTA domain-containing protein [Bacteroidales bacterium]|nr:PASTA domain-containing protein [Bacteroidales bacterium]